VEQYVNYRTKESSIPLWKKCDIVVSLIGENGTKVTKDLDIPNTTLATFSKNKDKIIVHVLIKICAKT